MPQPPHRFAAAILTATLFVLVPGAGHAQNPGFPNFEGLWQAIDTHDGSTQLLSVICSRETGCDVRLNDTAFTLSCPNQIGFAQGTGDIAHNVLSVELTLHCTNPDGSSTPVGSQLNEFVLDRRTGTLTNLNDDPVPLFNLFHRISR
jgi:hypothetical protein